MLKETTVHNSPSGNFFFFLHSNVSNIVDNKLAIYRNSTFKVRRKEMCDTHLIRSHILLLTIISYKVWTRSVRAGFHCPSTLEAIDFPKRTVSNRSVYIPLTLFRWPRYGLIGCIIIVEMQVNSFWKRLFPLSAVFEAMSLALLFLEFCCNPKSLVLGLVN
jgi:hypothetical protein